MIKLIEIIKIADIHANHISKALAHLSYILPITEHKVSNLSEDEFLWIELLINRFSKLQDFLGMKLISKFLESKSEVVERLTVIDQIHRLEALGIIDDSTIWQQMREIRNHLAHEYPDNPAMTALYLNKLFDFAPELIKILDNIKKHSTD